MKISSMAAALFASAAALGSAASTGAAAGTDPAMTASDCGNLFGQRCLVNLPTGVHMSYFDAGTQTGEILILLHTDTTSAVEWAWTVDALLAINPKLHIYALDQRGAGATDLPERTVCRSSPNLCMTQADLAADLRRRHVAR